MPFPKQPRRQNRDDGVRQKIRREHRKTDRKRQRDEKSPGNADHKKRRHEYGKNREHRKEPRRERFSRRAKYRLSSCFTVMKMSIDVLDCDGCLVDENSDSEREPAERHYVYRLSAKPQSD